MLEVVEKRREKIHFIAIGGVGMSGLAKYMIQKGYEVSGSDIVESKYTLSLRDQGARIFIGHKEENIGDDLKFVVVSSAISQDNVELKRAKVLGIELLHRSDLLEYIASEFERDSNSTFIGFSGTHGKTTTSGLATFILSMANKKPSFCTGGIIPNLDTNAKFDQKDFFVAELDESDGTIVKYHPDICVINNLEPDHFDFYKDGFKGLEDTFTKFLYNLKKESKIIVNGDSFGTLNLIKCNDSVRFITFGLKESCNFYARNINIEGLKSEFDVYHDGKFLAHIKLNILGKHNIYNALAVISALYYAKIELNEVVKYFERFTGMSRRFQCVCNTKNLTVYDDYAHHPSEIRATLESAKNIVKNVDRRLVAIFQPHRYSRLKFLFNEFLTSFEYADAVFVTDVFAASENPIDGIDSKYFVEQLKKTTKQYFSGEISQVVDKIIPYLKKNDFIVTLGAGDITKFGKILKEKIEQEERNDVLC